MDSTGRRGVSPSLLLSLPFSLTHTHTHTHTQNNYVRFQNSPFFSLSILIIDNRLTKEEEHTYNNYVRFQNSPFFSLSTSIIDNRLTKEEKISFLFVFVNVSKASRDFSKNPRSLIIYRSRGNYFASGNF